MISARIGLPIFIILIAAISRCEPLEAQERRCQPVDEAARKPDFFTFRARLQAAVARHDAEAVLAVVDPHIKNSFGGNDGIDAFKVQWSINEPDSRLWEKLGTVLALGGSFGDEGRFVAPYVFRCNADGFGEVVVLGANVRVRSKASSDAPVLTSLSFAIVSRAAGDDVEGWTRVKLDDGRTGFVASRLVRGPADYRAFFSLTPAGWRLAMFLAGD